MGSEAGDAFRRAGREIVAALRDGAADLADEGLKTAKEEAPFASGELREDLHVEVESDGKRKIVSSTDHSHRAEFIIKPFLRPAMNKMQRSAVNVVGGKIAAKVNELDIR